MGRSIDQITEGRILIHGVIEGDLDLEQKALKDLGLQKRCTLHMATKWISLNSF